MSRDDSVSRLPAALGLLSEASQRAGQPGDEGPAPLDSPEPPPPEEPARGWPDEEELAEAIEVLFGTPQDDDDEPSWPEEEDLFPPRRRPSRSRRTARPRPQPAVEAPPPTPAPTPAAEPLDRGARWYRARLLDPDPQVQDQALADLGDLPPEVLDRVLGQMAIDDSLVPGVAAPTHAYVAAALSRRDGPWAATLSRLAAFTLFCPPDTRDLSYLAGLPALRWLTVVGCPRADLLGTVADLPRLRHLGLADLGEPLDLVELGGSAIHELVLERTEPRGSMPFFLPELRRLAAWTCPAPLDLWVLEDHPLVQAVRVVGPLRTDSVEALTTLPALAELDLSQARLVGNGDAEGWLAQLAEGGGLARLGLPPPG